MAEPLDKIVDAYSNNRDWAVKAYQVGNQYNQVQGQLKQIEMQKQAQQMAIGEKIQGFMSEAVMMPEGPTKKAKIKQFQDTLAQMGVGAMSPENVAAMSDPNYRDLFAQTLSQISGLKGTPEGDNIFKALPGAVSNQSLVQLAGQLRGQLETSRRAQTRANSMNSVYNNVAGFIAKNPDLAAKYGITSAMISDPAVFEQLQNPQSPMGQNFLRFSEEAGQRERADQVRTEARADETLNVTKEQLKNTQKSTDATIAANRRNLPGFIATQKYSDAGASGLSVMTRGKDLREFGLDPATTDAQLFELSQNGDENASRALDKLTADYLAQVKREDKTKDKDKLVDDLAKEWGGIREKRAPIIQSLNNIDALLSFKGNKFTDQAILGSIQSSAEGVTSVVRANDAARFGPGSGLFDNFMASIQKLQGGGTYTDKDRANIKKYSVSLRESLKGSLKDAGATIYERAVARKLPANQIFAQDASLWTGGNWKPLQYTTPSGSTTVPGTGGPNITTPSVTTGNPGGQVRARPAAGARGAQFSPQTIQRMSADYQRAAAQGQGPAFEQALQRKGVSPAIINQVKGGR